MKFKDLPIPEGFIDGKTEHGTEYGLVDYGTKPSPAEVTRGLFGRSFAHKEAERYGRKLNSDRVMVVIASKRRKK